MKRLLALMLILALLFCGCNMDTDGSADPMPTEPGELVRPDVEIVAFDAPALVVRVTINPELELTLNRSNVILAVTPLNEDAEALLAELDVTGQPYNNGIVAILKEAKEQEFLAKYSSVSVAVREEAEGSWNTASQAILFAPITNYQKNTGVSFTTSFSAVEKGIDPSKLTLGDTEETDEYYRMDYFDNAGRHRLSKYYYNDGKYVEDYYPDEYDLISVTYYADGTYAYMEVKDWVQTSYYARADGTTYHLVVKTDEDLNPLWQIYSGKDGQMREEFFFYEDGRLVRRVMIDPDGNEWETVFMEDGGVQNPDGGVEYQNPDGTTTVQYPDGSTMLITYYEDGREHTKNRTYPNGDYENYTFRADGTIWKIVTQKEGLYIESEHDATGLLYRDIIRRDDGSEGEAIYYASGNLAYSNVTYANGDYETTHFFESGAISTYISQIDGEYTEIHYDENGNLVP